MRTSRNFDYNKALWSAVPVYSLAAYWFCALLILLAAHTGERWVPLLDSANLAFHEAGHPLFGLFSGELAVYGGTIGQLVFPIIASASFLQKRHTLSLSFALLWLAENLFNIARYMADARSQILPLVGNGEHDWTDIFTRWGLLESDALVAGTVRTFGWLLIFGVGFWLWHRYQDR